MTGAIMKKPKSCGILFSCLIAFDNKNAFLWLARFFAPFFLFFPCCIRNEWIIYCFYCAQVESISCLWNVFLSVVIGCSDVLEWTTVTFFLNGAIRVSVFKTGDPFIGVINSVNACYVFFFEWMRTEIKFSYYNRSLFTSNAKRNAALFWLIAKWN